MYQSPHDDGATATRQDRDSNATATSTNPKKGKKEKKETIEPPTPLPDWLPVQEWEAFKKWRAKIKHQMTEEAEQIAIRELEKLRADGNDPKAVLEQSIMRGWKGLFKLKGDQNENTDRRTTNSSGATNKQGGSGDIGQSKWLTAAEQIIAEDRASGRWKGGS